MRGLVLTDFYAMKKNLTLTGAIAVLYIVMGLVTGGSVELVAFFILFAAMQVISAFTYSERAKLDLFVNTLPILRKHIVLEKYVLMAILLVAAALLGCLSLLLCDLIYCNIEPGDYVSVLLVTMAGILFSSIVMPLIFKFGSEKARYMIVAIYIIPFLLFFAVSEYELFDFSIFFNLKVNVIIGGFAVLDIILLIASMVISIKIYEKKEF